MSTGRITAGKYLILLAIGAHIAHGPGIKYLRTIVAIVCMVVGVFILIRSLTAMA
ncbi:MAG: hypothetical protein ABR533_06870 [Desulfonatronovibrio sp.]|nr:hypothetical protein [Desulfovibrionales bacterium]